MALLPPSFLDTTVALGAPTADGAVAYAATGFLYRHPVQPTPDAPPAQYWIFLVTNRHVAANYPELHMRLNGGAGESAKVYTLSAEGDDVTKPWITHADPSVDVAVRLINAPEVAAAGTTLMAFDSEQHAFARDQASQSGISEGDGVFVLGFPLGLAGDERNYVIVRQGVIARIRDWLSGDAYDFLIDASIFPGNSGGPVLIKPEVIATTGTQPNHRCGLIGMVSSYVPYREIAVSKQTGRPRMIFEENSGLCVVVPVDQIRETVVRALETYHAAS